MPIYSPRYKLIEMNPRDVHNFKVRVVSIVCQTSVVHNVLTTTHTLTPPPTHTTVTHTHTAVEDKNK